MELRAHADCLIHGKNLGLEFGEITLRNLNKPYYIISHKNPQKRTGANVDHPEGGLASHLFSGNIKQLVSKLQSKGYKHILVEGGPTLLGSFLKENLIDEIFLTIAPKIFGNDKGNTLTLVEGYLFPPKATKKLKLLSIKQIGDELFLRYRVNKN